jgi:hypothetical protein
VAGRAACGGGMHLFSVTRDGTLRGEMKRYVEDDNMSRHKFAERGGDVLQICVFMTDIHIIGLKIGLKRHKFVSLRPIFLCLCVLRNAPLPTILYHTGMNSSQLRSAI